MLAMQGILTYCTTRTLPYHLYADECELFVLTAPLTSVRLSKEFFDSLRNRERMLPVFLYEDFSCGA